MPTQLQDYCLSHLGVVQYVPRDFCVPEKPAVDTAKVIVEPDVPETITPPNKSIAQVESSDQSVVSKVRAETVPAPAQEQADGSPATDPDLRFRISYWQLPDVLVFSSLDYGENPPQDQHQLLGNILQAVKRLSGILAEPELVDWPVVPTAPANAEAAKAMFTSLLKGRAEQTGSRWVLIMGQRAQQFLLAEEAVDGKVAVSERCQAVLTPGLDEMLADPQCKRTTWQQIRFLTDIPDTPPV